MGSSFTKYNGFGFWSKDELLTSVLFLISRELKKLNSSDNFVDEISDKIYNASTAGFIGCIPDHFDKFDNTEKSKLLRQAIESLIDGLKVDNYLTVTDLNENKVNGSSNWVSINLIGIEGTAKLMLQLLNGELKTNASSKIDYWTFLD